MLTCKVGLYWCTGTNLAGCPSWCHHRLILQEQTKCIFLLPHMQLTSVHWMCILNDNDKKLMTRKLRRIQPERSDSCQTLTAHWPALRQPACETANNAAWSISSQVISCISTALRSVLHQLPVYNSYTTVQHKFISYHPDETETTHLLSLQKKINHSLSV